MIGSIQRRATRGVVATLAVCVLSLTAQAGTIDINLTGFRIDYSTDDSQLHDRKDDDGGNLDPTEAVQLTGSEFMFEGNLVAQYNSSLGEFTYADLLVQDIDPTLTLPTSFIAPSISTGDNNGTFGFDWFYDDGGTLRNLRLNFDEVAVALFYNGVHIRPTIVVTGSTTNWSQSNLPAFLKFDAGSAITFSYTTTNTMAFDVVGNNFRDLLGSGGVMQITGTGTVPEPQTGLLLVIGAILLSIRLIPRRREFAWIVCR